MKCPECERTGQRSKMFMPDAYACTAMGGSQSFYDEDGEQHYHEINSSVGQGYCSNDHLLNVTASTKCRASGCDYGHPQSITFQQRRPIQPEPKYIRMEGLTVTFPREPGA